LQGKALLRGDEIVGERRRPAHAQKREAVAEVSELGSPPSRRGEDILLSASAGASRNCLRARDDLTVHRLGFVEAALLKKILLGIVVIVVVLVVVITIQPADFRVVRSTTVAAPAGVVYAQVSDFHNWATWSPWEKLDPNMKKTYGGTAGEQGSTYGWTGNDKVGEGRMTVISTKPNEQLGIKLEFLKPFAATNTTTFTLTPAAGGVQVEWAMAGTNDFLGKAVSLVMNMDKMVGGDFERGLVDLKAKSEGEVKRERDAADAREKADAAAVFASIAAAVAAARTDGGTIELPKPQLRE